MPLNWEPCFLLHARSFGDTSIIADVFTESSGKVSIMAKGAKNPRSKFFGHLLPFTALRIILTGKSEMKTLTQIDSNFFSQSVKGPHDLYTYLYVNELMMRLLPKGLPNQELYNLYQNFLIMTVSYQIDYLVWTNISHTNDTHQYPIANSMTYIHEMGNFSPLGSLNLGIDG